MKHSPHILVAAPKTGGHHSFYYDTLVSHLSKNGWRVTLACPISDFERAKDRISQSMSTADKVKLIPFGPLDSPTDKMLPKKIRFHFKAVRIWRQVSKLLQLAGTTQRQSVDALFLPWLDSFLSASSIASYYIQSQIKVPWTGFYFQASDRRLKSNGHRERALRLPSCKSLGILDEGVIAHFEKYINPKPVFQVSDFISTDLIDNDHLLHQLKERAAGRPIVSPLGTIDRRKQVSLFIDIAKAMDPNIFFFIGGRPAWERLADKSQSRLKQAINQPTNNLLVYPDYIPTEKSFNALVKQSDILFAAYKDFPHSSNIMTRAACYHKPVIVADGYCMAQRVEQFGLGRAIETDNLTAATGAIKNLLESKIDRVNYESFLKVQSKDNWLQTVDQLTSTLI